MILDTKNDILDDIFVASLGIWNVCMVRVYKCRSDPSLLCCRLSSCYMHFHLTFGLKMAVRITYLYLVSGVVLASGNVLKMDSSLYFQDLDLDRRDSDPLDSDSDPLNSNSDPLDSDSDPLHLDFAL